MAKNQTPGRKWFSRLLPILEENKGLTTSQKKAKAERDCRRILKIQSLGDWIIVRNGFEWEGPKKNEPRHKLTVWIKERKRKPGDPPPGDAPIPAKTAPPPSM